MTTGRQPRHQQAERLNRLIAERQTALQEAQRVSFSEALDDLVDRVTRRPPPLPPTRTRRPTPLRVPAAEDPGAEWWSPHSIYGYRMWELRWGRLHGAWSAWDTPVKTAECLSDDRAPAVPPGPIPHAAGECGTPPCGIYALKDPEGLAAAVDVGLRRLARLSTYALGLVTLTGRVVEHDHGYRGERAEVVSLAVITGAVARPACLTTLTGSAAIADSFRDPIPLTARAERQSLPIHLAATTAARFLRAQHAELLAGMPT